MLDKRFTLALGGLLAILLAACGASSSPSTPTTSPLTTPNHWLGDWSQRQISADPLAQNTPTGQVSERPTAAPATPLPTPTPNAAPSEPPVPQEAGVVHYTVQSGDTLLGLALHFDVSMASIQLLNGMGDSNALQAGQELLIATEPLAAGENTFWVVHVVQAGETLVGLGRTFGLSLDEILRVNSVADPALINIDQQLVIPLNELYTARPAPGAVAAVPAQAAAPPPAAADETNGAASAAQPVEASLPLPAPPAGEGDWSAYILAAINQVRAANGLPGLSMASELTLAAQAHAQDCAQRGWGSHIGSDGANLRTRLARVGYVGSNVGENWVQALNAQRAFEWWYGEIPPNDPHRRNILSPHYNEIGIGIADTGWGYIFVTDFGRR